MHISWIWFDLGYTLLYTPREEPYRSVLAALGHDVPLADLERAFHVVDKRFMRERPGVFGHDPATFMPWFLGELNWHLGIRLDLVDAWQRLRAVGGSGGREWLPFPGVREALADLRRRGYRLGVITNWDPSARTLLERTGLAPFFGTVIVSCEQGIEKPDPKIFRTALDAAGARAEESLYVGDNFYADAAGARKAGMQAVTLNRFGRLGVEELADEVILSHVSEVAGWLASRGA